MFVGLTGRFIMNSIWLFNFDTNLADNRNKVDFALGNFILIAFQIGCFQFTFLILLLQTNKNVEIDDNQTN